MHIGLITGIGPAATVVYYQKLCDGARARGAPLDLTMVQADAPTLVANNVADNRDAQAEIYAGLIDRLKAAGADCAAITSLGGHFCYAETVAKSSLPLVSAVEPLDEHFASQGFGTVGLLGTAVVMRTKLYGQLTKTSAIAPPNLNESGSRYQQMALSGACTDEDRAAFLAEGQAMMDAGAEAIVLAGTDLNLAFDGRDPGYPVIDALDVHVGRLLALALGEEAL